jgi:glycerol-3-phosphate dehydrogenase
MTKEARHNRLERLKKNASPTVLIVGGGINGISLYRELVLQGVDVVLVERSDFCVGASAALSRMVHGGLRYMEQGDFKLVREAIQERNRLLKNAPHYVFPLATTIPIFQVFSGVTNSIKKFLGLSDKPSRRGALIIKVGLALYDLFTKKDRIMPAHKFHTRADTLHNWPDFPDNVLLSATYYDAWITYPERLGLELISDMEEFEDTAQAFNYLEVLEVRQGKVTLKDKIIDQTIEIQPDIVVNATGAWVDFTNGRLKGRDEDYIKNKTSFVGGTKGSHLIVRNDELFNALGDHMVYYENKDGRVCILFRYFGNVLVGSTDLKIDDPDQVRCEEAERDYILSSLAFVFPNINITPEQILYRFSGVRPLVNSVSSVTGQISREHYCEILPASDIQSFPIISLIGGKWTTFRAFGARAADQVLEILGRERKVSTVDMEIGGGKDHPVEQVAKDQWISSHAKALKIPVKRLQELLDRYGTKALEFAATVNQENDCPLANHSKYSVAEIRHIVRNERVETLGDIIFRRTALAISGEINTALIDEILEILSKEKNWDSNRKSKERQDLFSCFSHFHGLTEADLSNRQPIRE